MKNCSLSIEPTRFLVPQNVFSLVNALTRAVGVRDWTDLGSGDGISAFTATKGLALARRSAVLLTSQTPPPLEGWTICNSEVKEWVDSKSTPVGDCVSMFDVIEHFDREQAECLLDKLARLFRLVIIFTPRGFLQQDPVTHPNLKDDPLMWHRCGFTEADFIARGYLTFFWPIFHFPLGQRPHGAVLAIRVEDATRSELQQLRLTALREHRRSLLTTPALRLFITRVAAWTVAGRDGLQFLMQRAS